MKLRSPPSSTSFYESFSDLIFATMLVFVFLTMILALQVNPEAVKTTRFTGGSGETYSLIAHARVDGVPSVIFVPVGLADAFLMARSLETNDPLLKLCLEARSEDGLVTLPIKDYARLHAGMSKTFAMGIRSWGEGTVEASLVLDLIKDDPRAFASLTPEQVKERIFGAAGLRVFQNNELKLSARQKTRYEANALWLQSKKRGDPHSWIVESRAPLRAKAVDEPPGRAWLRVGIAEDKTIRVGEVVLTPRQLRGLLRSIKAGDNFVLEHVDAAGAPAEPPAWFMEEVLAPAGFSARVL